jgi:hypothetical protein
MALELVQPGGQPLGQFDGLDSIYLTVKGGEVATITGAPVKGTDKDTGFASVGSDGYVQSNNLDGYRPVVTTVLVSGARPLCLVDDGVAGYGTMFGSIIGGIAGQISDGLGVQNGTLIGPHTATGSGKLTLWDKPGTYAVTLDAVDTTAGTGLLPTNPNVWIGGKLYATAAGKLTPTQASAFENIGVGNFLNFETYKGGALVTTPVSLVRAGKPVANRAVIAFNPPAA